MSKQHILKPDDEMVSKSRAAAILGMSDKCIDKLIRSGNLIAFKHGNNKTSSVRIMVVSIDEYLEKCRI